MKNHSSPDHEVRYLPIIMSIGISVGTAIGAAIHNIPLCMCVGMSAGVAIGAAIDNTNRKQSANQDKRLDLQKND